MTILTDGLRLDLDALAELARKATPGPWQVITAEHPWSLPECEVAGKTLPASSGLHKEHRISTTWIHGQLKDFDPIIAVSVGIGAEPGKPVHMAYVTEDNAAFIAALNPQTVLTLIDMARRAASPSEETAVGEAGTMPGTDGFTMAAFRAADVPVGTKLYARPSSPAAGMKVPRWTDVEYLLSIIDAAIEDGFDPDEDGPLLDQIRADIKAASPLDPGEPK